MKSATTVFLVVLVGLVLFMKSARPQLKIVVNEDKKPPVQVEPPVVKPKFTEDYEAAMAEKDCKVILVFGADWCPGCVRLKEHLKEANLDGYLVCFVDVGENRKVKRAHSVKLVPTSIICNKGEEVSRIVGFEAEKYDAWVEKNRE